MQILALIVTLMLLITMITLGSSPEEHLARMVFRVRVRVLGLWLGLSLGLGLGLGHSHVLARCASGLDS